MLDRLIGTEEAQTHERHTTGPFAKRFAPNC